MHQSRGFASKPKAKHPWLLLYTFSYFLFSILWSKVSETKPDLFKPQTQTHRLTPTHRPPSQASSLPPRDHPPSAKLSSGPRSPRASAGPSRSGLRSETSSDRPAPPGRSRRSTRVRRVPHATEGEGLAWRNWWVWLPKFEGRVFGAWRGHVGQSVGETKS